MFKDDVETLTLNADNKYNKKYEKLLPIRVDNTITIYHVKYDGKRIKKLIDKINNKYAISNDDVINTPFIGDVPLSMGVYDRNPYSIVKDYKVLKFKENSNYINAKEPTLYFPKDGYGKIKLDVETFPALSNILEDTLLTPDKYTLLDLTDLIKYRNYLFAIKNNFVFDKTIDLPNGYKKKSSTYKDKIEKFFTLNDYKQHLARLAYNLNQNKLYLNEKEERKIKSDIYDLINELQDSMEFEDIAMFPIEALNQNTKESETKKILTRYGDRNKDCNFRIFDTKWNGWFGEKLDFAKSNNDGAKTYNNLTKDIVFNYDIDGKQYEKKALKSIHETEPLKQILKIKKA